MSSHVRNGLMIFLCNNISFKLRCSHPLKFIMHNVVRIILNKHFRLTIHDFGTSKGIFHFAHHEFMKQVFGKNINNILQSKYNYSLSLIN